MDCPSCGTAAAPGQRFCSNCGTRLAAACPNCGHAVADNARFCGNCGTALGAPAEIASRPTSPIPDAVAERRLVTVLFADLVGFTTLSEARDAEAVRDLQARYFETAREVIVRYGGTVEKFIGDAVMAVWGAPVAQEDDAERAVRAALDLVESVAALDAALQLRAGVLTGEAAVTIGAEGQGMVTGDIVNTASRLQSVAPAGGVLVGQATRDAASSGISFEPVGGHQVKGKELPVAAWRAVRVVGMVGGANRSGGLEPPFEGREEEFRLLKELFNSTVRERRSRLVTVIGLAGTGKSRLTRELERYIDGLADLVYWHVGRSPSYGEGISFWALGEMVRKRAGLAETDDDETTRRRVAAVLEDFVPDDADRRWIEPRLHHLLGVGEVRTTQREELFGAWRMFFERLAERGPVVMAFEDLEAADPGMLDFIDYLMEWSRNLPMFVLALTRPELLERRPRWGAGQRNASTIALEPLSDEAMRDAVAGLVPGLPVTAVKAIVERAEGVPLYAVETVRMLINAGRLAEHDGVYQPVGDLTSLEIPDTLHALIAARLDALDREDRALLQDAAVLGVSFTVAALAGVSGHPADELETRLRSLVRREALELNVDPRSPERGQYAFVQGLVREVAYSTLSKRDRRSRHLAAARYYESLGDDELAGALAMHYLDAYRATPEGPEADAIAAQARVALRAAAERASALHSPAQALAYLEHLLVVTTEPSERASALERGASAAELAGMADASERYAAAALDAYRELRDFSGMGRAGALIARSYMSRGRSDAGLQAVSALMSELDGNDDKPGVIEFIATIARLHGLMLDHETTVKLADRALVAAEELDLVEIVAGAVMTKAISLSYLERNREAMILMPGVLQLAERNGFVVLEARARLNLSQFLVMDDPAEGFELARVGTERAQRLGLRQWERLLAGNALMCALHTGDWDFAIQLANEVLRDGSSDYDTSEVDAYPAVIEGLRGQGADRLARTIATYEPVAQDDSDPQYRSLFLTLRGWLRFIAGDLVAAADEIGGHAGGDLVYISAHYAVAGHSALWLRDLRRARAVLKRAEEIIHRGMWFAATRGSLAAGVAALEGRTAEATAEFAAHARVLREHGMPLDLALVLMDQVATLGVAEPAGRAAAQEAREVLTRLGAALLLERLDEATPGARPAPVQQTPRTADVAAATT